MKELKIHQATGKEQKETWLCLLVRAHAWLRKDVSRNCLKSISAQKISDENCSYHLLFVSDWLQHSSVMCDLSLQVRSKIDMIFLSPRQCFPHVTTAAAAGPGCDQGPVCWASSKATSWSRLCRWGKRRDSQLGTWAGPKQDSKTLWRRGTFRLAQKKINRLQGKTFVEWQSWHWWLCNSYL